MLEAPAAGMAGSAAPARARPEGSRPHHKALLMGARDALQASETQSPMGPDQKQSTHGDQRSRPPKSAPLQGRVGPSGVWESRDCLETSLQLSKFLLLPNWLIT